MVHGRRDTTVVLIVRSLHVAPKSPGVRLLVIETVRPKVLALLDILNHSNITVVPVLRVTQESECTQFEANRIAAEEWAIDGRDGRCGQDGRNGQSP